MRFASPLKYSSSIITLCLANKKHLKRTPLVGNFRFSMANPKFANPVWHLIDAKNQVVGRLATQISHILRGKHKPTFTRNCDCGDYIVVINAKDVKLTGLKHTDKLYTWHTGHVGGLKQRPANRQMDKIPEEILRKAVLGMLSKNNLRYAIARKLRIFPGEQHLHYDKLPLGTPTILSE